jgi:hypothetical protein
LRAEADSKSHAIESQALDPWTIVSYDSIVRDRLRYLGNSLQSRELEV